MSQFEIGQTYKPRYGSEQHVFTVVDRDENYIYFTKQWVQNKVFREKYHQMNNSELLRTDPWTTSDDVY